MSDTPELEAPKGRRVVALDVDELPVGRKLRLLVEMVHDSLGHAIRVPVLVARGDRPGPVFGITAALHGNELNGIPVIHQLFERLDPHKLRGTAVAVVVVNVPGFLMHQRGFIDGRDLNHIFPGREGGNIDEVYVHRLVDRIVSRFDFLVDLHTASFGRINSLYVRADMTDATTAQMAYLQRPQIIVHNPASDRTLRGTAMELGIPAITLEIGNPQSFQPEYIRSSLVGLRSVMAEAGMLPRRAVAPGLPPVVCSASDWLYTDCGGLLRVFPGVTEVVPQGAVIARLTNAFGDLVCEYKAPSEGIVIGKSVNPVGQTGARILHLGAVTDLEERSFHPRVERIALRGRRQK